MYHALKPSLGKDDSYLSHLPLYLRLEFTLINALFLAGVTVGFATDGERFLLSSAYNPKCCPASYGDIQSFGPTILFGIKPWWDIIHGLLLDAVQARPPAEQDAFWKWVNKKKDVVGVKVLPLVHTCEKWGHIAEIRTSFFGDRIRWLGVACGMMPKEQRQFLGLVLGGVKGIMVEGLVLPQLNSYAAPSSQLSSC